jgi:exopolysaccharide biosynthesis polyprenyl glycosylphosphotransferase
MATAIRQSHPDRHDSDNESSGSSAAPGPRPRPLPLGEAGVMSPTPRLMSRVISRSPRLVVTTLDGMCVMAGLAGTYALSGRLASGGTHLVGRLSYLSLTILGVVVFLAAFRLQRLYSARCITRPADELRRLVGGCLLGAGGLVIAAFMLRLDVSRGWIVAASTMVFACVAVERSVLRELFRRARSEGQLLRKVVVLGANTEARAIRDMLISDQSLGYRVVDSIDLGCDLHGKPPSLDQLIDVVAGIERSGASGVVLAASALDLATSNWLVRSLTDAGVHVELSSTLLDVAPSRLTVRPLGRFPVVYVEPTERDGWRAKAKRSFDLTLTVLGLIMALPILAVAALAIKLSSPGPVLFRQERVGLNGTTFHVLKLRTMVTDAEERLAEIAHLNEAQGPLFKVREDPRVTGVGRFLRSTSLDELPQLFNVLKGEMSLVGPRPALPREVAQWCGDLHGRLRVKPGITGMWQVSGRSDSSFDDYQRLDLYYVDNWSLVTDLSIMLRTVPAVVLRRGAH